MIENFIKWIIPFLIIPFTITIIRTMLNIIINIMKGNYLGEQKEMNINVSEKQDSELKIDEDLMKYFNYEEKKNV